MRPHLITQVNPNKLKKSFTIFTNNNPLKFSAPQIKVQIEQLK